MEYLFPVPARPLRSLLDHKAATGAEFTEQEAALDVMLMMDAGKTESLRTLSARWNWPRMRVSRGLENLQSTAAGWRAFNTSSQVGQLGTGLGQLGTKTGENTRENAVVGTLLGQLGTGLGQPDYIHPRATELQNSELQINKPKPSTKPETRRKDRTQDIDFDQVLESWNTFAAPLGLPICRSLNDKRRAAIRKRYRGVWPHIEEVYDRIRGSGFLLGEGGRGWRVSFDFVWTRNDGAQKILEGNYDERSTENTQDAIRSGPDSSGGGILIHHLVPGNGEAVPGGVYPKRLGGHQQTRRSQTAYKRTGALSRREHLERCGWSPEQIDALLASEHPGNVSPGGAAEWNGGGEDPIRPLLRLRA